MNYKIEVYKSTLNRLNDLFNLTQTKDDKEVFHSVDINEYEKKYINDEECKKLGDLFDYYGSDKALDKYHYFYFDIFKKSKIENMFEIGIGTNNIFIRSNMGQNGNPGASLKSFSKFYGINVYGADIDKNILFNNHKIKTFFLDQTNIDSFNSLKNKIPNFDLIIDDGLHLPNANLNAIIELINKLNSGGIMVIEDVEFNLKGIFETFAKILCKQNFRVGFIKCEKCYLFTIEK